ncbi:hypothetical protein INN71_00880 [Nocardioides sp. ChNu-153]|uniref:hypothetical protein n=1 Tax=unclassified Nocardioides TaxID=2615069 RepID=UPI002405AB90|nr:MULTISPECIES: hypothetical protein [unclassified Nocardioides]MDF9714528.1 hypothetical protein [Nocardioides sp. ChNu-99]MDN7119939.1 hypothetical protein [Nocardioides sp. ChNu-153]
MLLRTAAVGLLALPFAVGAATAPAPVAEEGTEVTRFTDSRINESSGLALVDGRLVTVNDSGDSGRVFVVDPATGDTVGVTSWAAEPRDVEALAPAYDDGEPTGEVWVADIGDNRAVRETVELLRVPVGTGDREVEPEAFTLTYADGPRDAESLLVDPATGDLVVVSKGVLGGSFYRVPSPLDPDGPNVMEPLGPAVGIATDAAFLPDGRHLVVRTYGEAVVYSWPDLASRGRFALPDQPQGEAVAVDPADPDALLVTSEGVEQPVLRVALPPAVLATVGGPAPGTSDGSGGPGGTGETGGSGESEAPTGSAGSATPSDGPQWGWLAGGVAVVLLASAVLVLVGRLALGALRAARRGTPGRRR